MKNKSIDKIEKAVENILPTSGAFIDELDYSVIEQKKADWLKLSELAHSIVLVFDCCTKKFVFVSDNIPQSYGIDSKRLFINGHEPVLEIIHPGDIHYGLLVRKKIYSLLSSLSEQAIELDKSGSIWLMLSVIDVDASHESETTKSHLYNFETGEQIFIDLSDTLEEPLTNRELSVLQLMKQGLLSKEIANFLNVSINTINTHRQNILLKLKVNNSIEAVNIAQRLGLINNSTQKHIFSETD